MSYTSIGPGLYLPLELCYIICLDIRSREKYGKRDLLDLALSCKHWLDPALDVLWERVTGLEPLLALAPQTALRNRQLLHGVNGLLPYAPVKNADTSHLVVDWTRFDVYAHRIREIKATSCWGGRTSYDEDGSDIGADESIDNSESIGTGGRAWVEDSSEEEETREGRTGEAGLLKGDSEQGDPGEDDSRDNHSDQTNAEGYASHDGSFGEDSSGEDGAVEDDSRQGNPREHDSEEGRLVKGDFEQDRPEEGGPIEDATEEWISAKGDSGKEQSNWDSDQSSDGDDPDAYEVIIMLLSMRRGPLTPSLRRLKWTQKNTRCDIDPLLGSVLSAFVAPTLQAISIEVRAPKSAVWGWSLVTDLGGALGKWFAALPEKVPNLKIFRLGGYLAEFPLDFISRLVTLEELDLSDLHMGKAGWVKAPLLRSFAPLTQVKTFGVIACIEKTETIEGDFSIFPRLETFHAENTMPLETAAILRGISSKHLKYCYLNEIDEHLQAEQTYVLCQSLTKFAATLTTLRLDFEEVRDSGSPDSPRIFATIGPLLELRCLEKFYMSPCFAEPEELSPYLITDTDIQQMIFAWPNLRELRLNLCPVDRGITLQSLVAFADHTPDLRSLDLYSLDVSEDLDPTTIMETNHPLEILNLVKPTYANPGVFARALDRMFPHLNTKAMVLCLPEDVLEHLDTVAEERRSWQEMTQMMNEWIRSDAFK